ncbi:unnamed protein product [Penicillium roqueforti FM164]|uniref:Genomic scaffold, ProqFM164S02 n=1 Tax=Penicillium roqueforti (strain FM164) TaxID=1365484 RepID=W6QSU7_PENRF|nr:unnamed protein product [Penicillium roqueforti FM164]
MAKNHKAFWEQADHCSKVQLHTAPSCYPLRSTWSRSKHNQNPLKPATGLHKHTASSITKTRNPRRKYNKVSYRKCLHIMSIVKEEIQKAQEEREEERHKHYQLLEQLKAEKTEETSKLQLAIAVRDTALADSQRVGHKICSGVTHTDPAEQSGPATQGHDTYLSISELNVPLPSQQEPEIPASLTYYSCYLFSFLNLKLTVVYPDLTQSQIAITQLLGTLNYSTSINHEGLYLNSQMLLTHSHQLRHYFPSRRSRIPPKKTLRTIKTMHVIICSESLVVEEGARLFEFRLYLRLSYAKKALSDTYYEEYQVYRSVESLQGKKYHILRKQHRTSAKVPGHSGRQKRPGDVRHSLVDSGSQSTLPENTST